MSEDEDTGDDGPYQMRCSLGDLELKVKGSDPDWVEEQFEKQWMKRMREASEMKEAIRDADPHTH